MASFPFFPRLPVELQLAIWRFAMPDPEPEVCIAWPLYIEGHVLSAWICEAPALPFVVDIAWPAIAHVCRVAREAAFSTGALCLRHSRVAGMPVPCRRFIPARDTLYWSSDQAHAMYIFLNRPENTDLVRQLRSIAVELAATNWPPVNMLNIAFLRHAVNLHTLSVVFPGAGERISNLNPATCQFLPPARRCKFRNLPPATLKQIKIVYHPERNRVGRISTYLRRYRRSLESGASDGSLPGLPPRAGGAATAEERPFMAGVEIKPQMFVEYGMAEHGREEQWADDVCMDRLLGNRATGRSRRPRPLRIPVADRKDPERYRVLDDDNTMQGVE